MLDTSVSGVDERETWDLDEILVEESDGTGGGRVSRSVNLITHRSLTSVQ